MKEFNFTLNTKHGRTYHKIVQAKTYADAIDLISFDIRQGAVIQKFTESRIRYKYVIHIVEVEIEKDYDFTFNDTHVILSPKRLSSDELNTRLDDLYLEIETDSHEPYEGSYQITEYTTHEVLYEA